MTPFRPLLLTGMLTACVTALAAYGLAGDGGLKTLILELPDDSVQQIPSVGAAPVQIVMPQPQSARPMRAAFFTPATMNPQAPAMVAMNAMNAMMAGGVPGGVARYAFVSALSGGAGGTCVESVQITVSGLGQAPQVLSRRVGDCTGGPFSGPYPAAEALPAVRPLAPAVPAALPRPLAS